MYFNLSNDYVHLYKYGVIISLYKRTFIWV